MSNRQFKVALSVSVVLLGCTIILCLATLLDSSRGYSLKLTDHFHVGVCPGFNGDMLDRLVVFSDAQGPYRGSMLTVGDEQHEIRKGWHVGDYGYGRITTVDEKGRLLIKERAGDFPGIYYRHFLFRGEAFPLWTLMVSLWYPLVLFSILPTVRIMRRWKIRAVAA